MSLKLRFLYRAYRYRFRVDPSELRFVCKKLQPGQVAVDVGCHKGAYTYWMRRRVGSSGHVFAFEPQPRQVEYLRRAFADMRYKNVTLVPMGLSRAPGRLPLYAPAGPGMTHSATLEHAVASGQQGAIGEASNSVLCGSYSVHPVEVTTLDAFFAHQPRRPDFLKIDVEGHELAVLEGALQTLDAHRPAILLECEARHRPDSGVRPVFELLRSLGYAGSFFHNGRRRPLAEFKPAELQHIDPTAAKLRRGYVNNFAFEHNSKPSPLRERKG
jgi:FkbM family methyltransferase